MGFSFAGVLILSAMANRFRIHKLSKVDQFVMSYGGMQSCPARTTPNLAQQPSFSDNDRPSRCGRLRPGAPRFAGPHSAAADVRDDHHRGHLLHRVPAGHHHQAAGAGAEREARQQAQTHDERADPREGKERQNVFLLFFEENLTSFDVRFDSFDNRCLCFFPSPFPTHSLWIT